MDLGLGNLSELKRHLLNAALRTGTQYDAQLAALGRGVAARFEAYCTRKFARVEGDTHTFGAERASLSLPRYPVEEITAVALRESLAEGWVDQGAVDAVIEQLYENSGVVLLAAPLGSSRGLGRITYTGGFWWATSGLPLIQTGTVELVAAAETATVNFSEVFPAVPFVFPRVRLAGSGALVQCSATAVRRSGFTLQLAAPASGTLVVDWFAVAESAPASGLVLGTATAAAGLDSLAVAFAESFDSAPIVLTALQLPSGAAVIGAVPASVTAAGFTAHFGASLPAGARLVWVALDPDSMLADDLGSLQGSEGIAVDAETVTLTFPSAFSATPRVFTQLVTSAGLVIEVAATAVSTAGFTVALAAPAPAGSTLSWLALPGTLSAATAPEGATERPHDLFEAWLKQCAHEWALTDVEGLGAARDRAGTSPELSGLSRLELVPEVQRVLGTYRRLTIL